jgi:hypothetical protein
MTDLRYPTGKFIPPDQPTKESRHRAINTIAETPDRLRAAVQGLDEDQLDTPYRPGGWTIRQVVHHVPDSHHERVHPPEARADGTGTGHQAVTNEAAWAELVDTIAVPIDPCHSTCSMPLHRRWIALLRAMKEDDFRREYVHPESGRHAIDYMVAMYAWHGPHHVAHITTTRERMGW